jgi:hypothetical protein
VRKFKTLCTGLVVAMVLSIACVGVSAATPPAKTSPANKTVAASENTALTASDKAEIAQEVQALQQKFGALKAADHNSIANVVTPDFNYGPNGGPGLHTLLWSLGGIVQNGDVGWCVQEIQHNLATFGETMTIDGYYGNDTYIGVKAFQEFYNDYKYFGPVWGYISEDGIVGKDTYNAMVNVCGYDHYTFYGAD